MSDDNKVWKVIGIFLCCLLCICCIGVIGWYLYVLTYGTEKMTVGTVNNSVLEKADGSSAYIIEIDYKSNANNNGLELFDLKLNYFTDETREYIYSKGLQYVAGSPSDKIEWVEYSGAEEFDKYLDENYDQSELLDVLTPILQENMTFYTVKHTGWWIFDNPYKAIYYKPFVNPFTNSRYEYQALEGQEFTGSTNPITDDSFFTISYLNEENQSELLYMKFCGDNYVKFTSADEFMNDDRQIAQGGRSVAFNYYSVDFFAYYLYNSIQKLPLGTNGTYTFEFGNDMFQYFEVNEDGSFGEEILNEDRDLVTSELKTYFTIKVNVSADGAKNSSDSIFGIVHGSSNFTLDGSTDESGQYFQGKQVILLDTYDFDILDLGDGYCALMLSDETYKKYSSYAKNIYLSINIDPSLINNYTYLGLYQDSRLQEFTILEINDGLSSISEVMTC